MNPTTATPKKPAAPGPAISEDLSKAIDQTVVRLPDEQVKTVRLFDDYYRCNWWTIDKSTQAAWLNSGKIRKSSFLRVKRQGDQLVIEDLGKRTPTKA